MYNDLILTIANKPVNGYFVMNFLNFMFLCMWSRFLI